MADLRVPFRRHLRDRLARYPRIYVAALSLTARARVGRLIVGRRTDIVIEGYPRSANTFAVTAFLHAQPGPVSVAHHLHSEAHVLEGVRRRLPVLVLVRRPGDAVRSLCVMYPALDPAGELERRIRFHTAVERVRDHVVIGDFAVVTQDFGRVIARVNARFATDFARFHHGAEAIDRVDRSLRAINRADHDGSALMVSLPDPRKAARLKARPIELPADRLAVAEAIHARLVSGGA